MTQMEHPRNGGLKLFLAFAGGALVGGAAAVLFTARSGAETRRRITSAADDAKRFASRMPQAIRDATSAAQTAFAAALKESTAEDGAASPSHRFPPRHRS
jgi:gas vesicle protein